MEWSRFKVYIGGEFAKAFRDPAEAAAYCAFWLRSGVYSVASIQDDGAPTPGYPSSTPTNAAPVWLDGDVHRIAERVLFIGEGTPLEEWVEEKEVDA